MTTPKKLALPDGSSVDIVSTTPQVGEIDQEVIESVKFIMSQFPGAKVVGSVPRVL